MAGYKISTKAKGKEDKSKLNKVNLSSSNEEIEEIDYTLLRKPISTSITGFAQARTIFDLATVELKDMLSNECDVLYECKVCRNIFRSLINFISHKRVYCKEKFSLNKHAHFFKSESTISELDKIITLEKSYKESLEVTNEENEEDNERIPMSKDLTSIIENIAKKRGATLLCNNDEEQVSLQKIPTSSVAMYQNLAPTGESDSNSMRSQVKELENMLSSDKAILQTDGNFKIQSSEKIGASTENVIQISDDEDNDERFLKCQICDLRFSTQKTLKFHMKYKHLESRLVYPCPDCLEIFSTSWSVYRHLFKVHRKTAAQIRRLRESIQAKAFKMNNPPAFYEKRKNNSKSSVPQKITEEERIDQENQAWMDNMEGAGPPPPRPPARRPDKRIEIQIRKDYHKEPAAHSVPPALFNPPKTSQPFEKLTMTSTTPKDESSEDLKEKCKDESMEVVDDDKASDTDLFEKLVTSSELDAYQQKINLPFAQIAETSNFIALKQKMLSDIITISLTCKLCNIKQNNIQELYSHMATHYKWMRYACKLCNIKEYEFEKLLEHVKVVHKLKGDTEFYYTTIKAIDGNEAVALLGPSDEANDIVETSSESRRPSRCSSDSSRLSDDSSSSSIRNETGSKKRKMVYTKGSAKRKKEIVLNGDEDSHKDNETSPSKTDASVRNFEENSSDIDDSEDKIAKRNIVEVPISVASRRPIRKRPKPKNDDFEYDLSNLLKMKTPTHREPVILSTSKVTVMPSPKINQYKKKTLQVSQNDFENLNKGAYGAMIIMSKKSAANSTAHYMRTPSFESFYQVEKSSINTFARPFVPKAATKADKISPKKDTSDDVKNKLGPNKVKLEITADSFKNRNHNKTSNEIKTKPIDPQDNLRYANKEETVNQAQEDIKGSEKKLKDTIDNVEHIAKSEDNIPTDKAQKTIDGVKNNLTSVLPLNIRRQSLEVIKNPLINKNISDFSKAGMKTKILVIKPINRNKDGKSNTALKFQTIKLKDPSKASVSTEEKLSDQVVVVKVPKVDCAVPRPVPDTCSVKQTETPIETIKATNNNEVTKLISEQRLSTLDEKKKCNEVTESSSDSTVDETQLEIKDS